MSSEGWHAFEELSHEVLGACVDVQRVLGVHCMEVDYQRALEQFKAMADDLSNGSSLPE